MREYHKDWAKHYSEQADKDERSVAANKSGLATLPPSIIQRLLYNIPMLRRYSSLHKAQAEKHAQGT